VTAENQRRAEERIPILRDLPFKHKGIMCAPFIGPVSSRAYLESIQIEQVLCGGENYDGARPCHYEWVKSLRQECVDFDVTFFLWALFYSRFFSKADVKSCMKMKQSEDTHEKPLYLLHRKRRR